MKTREEHLEWCKQRSREYCDRNDAQNAIASMMSDLQKHPETEKHAGIMLGAALMMGGMLQSTKQAREFIEGFN